MKRNTKIKLLKIFFLYAIILGLLSTTMAILCINGSRKIFSDIEKIVPVNHRELERIKDGDELALYNDESDKPFKILQLSDIHLSCSYIAYKNDLKAIQAVEKIVRTTEPDLIVLTGDILYPLFWTLNTNNYLIAEAISLLMQKLGIPWSIIFGNHDSESYATLTREELSLYFQKNELCLFDVGPSDVYGYGNYIVKLYNHDRSLNRLLVMMDSNSYVPNSILNDYDNIHQDQIDWYQNKLEKIIKKEQKLIPSTLYIHIPFGEYLTAWNLYQHESPEILYIDGEANEGFSGPKREDLMFETIKKVGSTDSVFCGHDHENTYAIKYQDVILSYGLSIDYLAYPLIYNKTTQRGGTLLSINQDGTFSFDRKLLINI